jgi:hypothetical protein
VDHLVDQQCYGVSCTRVFEDIRVEQDGDATYVWLRAPVGGVCCAGKTTREGGGGEVDCVFEMSGEERGVEAAEYLVHHIFGREAFAQKSSGFDTHGPQSFGCVCLCFCKMVHEKGDGSVDVPSKVSRASEVWVAEAGDGAAVEWVGGRGAAEGGVAV